MATFPAVPLPTATSGIPSLLKSPTASEYGVGSAAVLIGDANNDGGATSVCASVASSTAAVKIWFTPLRVSDQKGWATPSTETICM